MTHYATLAPSFQRTEEELRCDRLIKEIGYCQQNIATQLSVWLRCKSGSPETARAAMARLLEARVQENRLFQMIFGIHDDILAITKREDV